MTKIQKAGPRVSPSSEARRDEQAIEVGQWYWVDGGKERWLGCAVRIGTNYVKLRGAFRQEERVHLDEFGNKCVLEPDPDAHIDEQIRRHKSEVDRLMGRVRELTARLGVAPSPELTSGGETQALARVEAGRDFKSYSKDLVKAKEQTLPGLFKKIEEENGAMAAWMKAKVIPLKAQAEGMKEVIGRIEDRIFSVELYAGLVEKVEQVADGDPAPIDTKVHLLQRRHYMDEECLARYEAGGMEFKDIGAFDRWLCRPQNLERLLPFPRCAVAFRVRRKEKGRHGFSISDFVRILELEDLDKTTFLYIRNGDKVFRLNTALDFGEKLFPDMDRSKLSGKRLWAKRAWSGVEKIITDDEYQGLVEDYRREVREHEERQAAYEAAIAAPEAMGRARKKGLKEPDASCVDVPWPGMGPWSDPAQEWSEYTQENVYYDDITAKIAGDIKHHNRVALVLQGLLDRSPVFHPHPPWQIWTNEGFQAALDLVYDEDRALTSGEKPDFKAYRERLNESLKEGSVTVGQQDAWERHEGAKESERRRAGGGSWHLECYCPPGNPGPGTLARVFKRGRDGCTYAWNRERQTSGPDGQYGDPVRTTFTCGTGQVLNVDAYRPGDFKIFFDDPRTRADYLRWAPLLLEAEEFHAGNREAPDPVPPGPAKKSSWEGRRRYAQRKLRKQLTGKAVRLARKIETRGGTVHEAGTLWRVGGGEGATFTIVGILPDGSHDGSARCIRGVDPDDFVLDESVPGEPDLTMSDDEDI